MTVQLLQGQISVAVSLSTDRIADKLLRLFHISPADDLYPFAGFKILVVLKKVLDLLQRDSGQVSISPHMLVVLRYDLPPNPARVSRSGYADMAPRDSRSVNPAAMSFGLQISD